MPRPPRISCSEHGTVQVEIPWSERSSRFTGRFEVMAIDVLISTDVKSASGTPGITWNEAWHIMQIAVSRGLARKTSTPARIGIDEKSCGKHHHYATIVYNLDSPAVDHIEFDRKKESLDLYYAEIGKDASGNIEAVSFWKKWHWWASHSRLNPVKRVARMMKHHLYGILSYFRHHITNAMAEGLNSKISPVQKMSCGFRNREHFKIAIHLHYGNLQLYPDTHRNLG